MVPRMMPSPKMQSRTPLPYDELAPSTLPKKPPLSGSDQKRKSPEKGRKTSRISLEEAAASTPRNGRLSLSTPFSSPSKQSLEEVSEEVESPSNGRRSLPTLLMSPSRQKAKILPPTPRVEQPVSSPSKPRRHRSIPSIVMSPAKGKEPKRLSSNQLLLQKLNSMTEFERQLLAAELLESKSIASKLHDSFNSSSSSIYHHPGRSSSSSHRSRKKGSKHPEKRLGEEDDDDRDGCNKRDHHNKMCAPPMSHHRHVPRSFRKDSNEMISPRTRSIQALNLD